MPEGLWIVHLAGKLFGVGATRIRCCRPRLLPTRPTTFLRYVGGGRAVRKLRGREPCRAQAIHYGGHLLWREKEQPWMLAPREALRRRWLEVVKALGDHRVRSRDWTDAAEVCRHALTIDPLPEELYRRLMVPLGECGHRAEAASTYVRCREQLCAVLGVTPSAETERVYRTVVMAG